MKTFKEWLKIKEMAGVSAIVTKKDCSNKNFNVWGAVCNKKKSKK